MVDIINTPTESGSGGTAVLVGGIAFVLFALFVIFYGLPALRGTTQNSAPEAQVQEASNAEAGVGSNITVPEQIDVNVNQPQE